MDPINTPPNPDPAIDLVSSAQEPDSILQDWRAGVLNVLLPVVTLAILPALIQTIYQVFIYHGIGWQGPAVYVVFYLFLVYISLRRSLSSTTRGWFLVGLTFLTGLVAMARGGLAGDGRIYLVIVPILAVTLINTNTGLYTAVVSLLAFCVFGALAQFGLLNQWLIRLDNPLDMEYWLYSGLTLATIVIAIVFMVVRFSKFQIQTLESSKKIAKALSNAYRQVETANLQLEQKVQQRTAELMQSNRRLEFLATHDSLTGLPNRLLVYDRLDQAIKKGQRNKARFALLFIDLDDFKGVNDTFGHPVGDLALKEVGETLSQCVRISDTVARLAGDEFALILDDVQAISDIEVVVSKVSNALNRPIRILDNAVSITASIGVSVFPEHGTHADTLFKKADQAMYLAKSKGKNQYVMAE